MRMAITSFSALLIGLSLLAIIPALDSPDSETLVDRSRGASMVLEPPVLKGIELVDDDLILQMQWKSHWAGGELDIPGTLFVDHRDQPAGRAIALSIDASALALDANCRIRIPLDGADRSNQVLRDAEFADLRVMFSSGQ